MALRQTLQCGCNPGYIYANETTFRKHFDCERHQNYERATQEIPALRQDNNRKQNKIFQLEHSIRLARNLMQSQGREVRTLLRKIDTLESDAEEYQVKIAVLETDKTDLLNQLTKYVQKNKDILAASIKDHLKLRLANQNLWGIINCE
jgi:nitrate reductase NapAB chaperone NapD